MNSEQPIRVLFAAVDSASRERVLAAMHDEGWDVRLVEDFQELIPEAESGMYHMAVVACQDRQLLPKAQLHRLMSLQSDMAVVFLVDREDDIERIAALAGASSDRFYPLKASPKELIDALKRESLAVVSDQLGYTIMCVDDDDGFLTSLMAILPSRLKAAFPRFDLRFEFYNTPQEALARATATGGENLAVVISDQIMPIMSGVQLLGRIKDISPQTQRVLLTGHATLDSAIAAINDRILDKYFSKPIEDPVDFANNIAHLLRGYYLQQQSDSQRRCMTAVFELMRTINAAKSPDDALDGVVGFLSEWLNPSRIVVALAENGKYAVRAGFRLPPELPLGTIASDNDVFFWRLQQGGRLPMAKDLALEPGISQSPFARTPWTVLPLAPDGASIGFVLIAKGDDERPPTRSEKILMRFAADAASVGLAGFNDRRALEDTCIGVMASLLETVEAKDSYTHGHTERVTRLVTALGRAVGLKGENMKSLAHAAALHDIGKIAIPDWIIMKPTSLDEAEYSVIQEHSARADKILQHLRFLAPARQIVRAHHERYDGQGYPDGLVGDEIPLGARILAIADTYDAITSERPYRKAMPPEAALAEIEDNSGTQFDPQIVAVFAKLISGACRKTTISARGATAPSEDIEIHETV